MYNELMTDNVLVLANKECRGTCIRYFITFILHLHTYNKSQNENIVLFVHVFFCQLI